MGGIGRKSRSAQVRRGSSKASVSHRASARRARTTGFDALRRRFGRGMRCRSLPCSPPAAPEQRSTRFLWMADSRVTQRKTMPRPRCAHRNAALGFPVNRRAFPAAVRTARTPCTDSRCQKESSPRSLRWPPRSSTSRSSRRTARFMASTARPFARATRRRDVAVVRVVPRRGAA
jgi:hypothetical protein